MDANVFAYSGNDKIDFKTPKARILGDGAFYRCLYKSIIIDPAVEVIGNNAFEGCHIDDIKFPSVFSIGEAAFKDCSSLYGIEFGAEIKYIGPEAFLNCLNLKYISEFKVDIVEIPRSCFENCSSFSGNALNSIKEAIKTVNIIGERAFFGAKFDTKLELTSSLQRIGAGAFLKTNIQEITYSSDSLLESDSKVFEDGIIVYVTLLYPGSDFLGLPISRERGTLYPTLYQTPYQTLVPTIPMTPILTLEATPQVTQITNNGNAYLMNDNVINTGSYSFILGLIIGFSCILIVIIIILVILYIRHFREESSGSTSMDSDIEDDNIFTVPSDDDHIELSTKAKSAPEQPNRLEEEVNDDELPPENITHFELFANVNDAHEEEQNEIDNNEIFLSDNEEA